MLKAGSTHHYYQLFLFLIQSMGISLQVDGSVKTELEFLLLLEELEDVPQSVLKVGLSPTTVCCFHSPDTVVTTLWLYIDKALIIFFEL